MDIAMSKLSAKRVQSVKERGMYGDGLGLYLNVAAGGTKSWILRTTVKGQTKRREIGLGSVDTLSLADARLKAGDLRKEAKAGRDPATKRDEPEQQQISFKDAAHQLHAMLAPTFRNEKHKAQWLSSLNNHVFLKIGSRNVAEITRQEVLEVLSPIWIDMNPTASRLKQRMEAVFDRAIGTGAREAANPVDGALRRALPKGKHKPKHHAALGWQEVPQFIQDLAGRKAIAALCLQFVILTAARSGEARMATWKEVNLDKKTWIVPANRMKADEEHRVPLSDEAVAILREVQGLDPEILFPSPQSSARGTGKPLSVNAFRPLFQRMKREGVTAHGFRSSFRDWCAEKAHADRQLAEAALALRVGGVEGADCRSDLVDRRRTLVEAWGR
jgi:integrase